MNLTNDIKRIRKKLEIFEMEGSQEVMEKLITQARKFQFESPDIAIRWLKLQYKVELAKLLEKRQKYRQTKIKFDEDKTKKS